MTKYVEGISDSRWDKKIIDTCHWQLNGQVLQLIGQCPRCLNELNYTVEAIWQPGIVSSLLEPKTVAICQCIEAIEDRKDEIKGCGAVFNITGLKMPPGTANTELEHG